MHESSLYSQNMTNQENVTQFNTYLHFTEIYVFNLISEIFEFSKLPKCF